MEREFEKLIGDIAPTKEYVQVFRKEVMIAWKEEYADYEKKYQIVKRKELRV